MIKVKNLSRNFGSITAVDNVTFDANVGEVLGFLGPNGAGKTTTMRIITGYLEPSAGKVSVGGADVRNEPKKAKRQIGYLPENAPIYRDMHVLGFLKFIAEIRNLKGQKAKDAIDRTISICHLDSVLYQSIDTLSKGYVRRTVLAQAILHDPPILILDEPTDGLDPNQKHEVRKLINTLSTDKVIIISTHILEEVEACCTRAIIIANGRIVANDSPQKLKSMSDAAGSIVMGIGNCSFETVRESLSGLDFISRVSDAGSNDNCAKVRVVPSKTSSGGVICDLSTFARQKSWEISDFYMDSGHLNEVFRTITTENKGE